MLARSYDARICVAKLRAARDAIQAAAAHIEQALACAPTDATAEDIRIVDGCVADTLSALMDAVEGVEADGERRAA